jgi:hypothetical protein
MRAIVVAESYFGNTARLAQEVEAGVAEVMDTELVSIEGAPEDLRQFDRLVVGAPTHAFGMSRPATRGEAVTRSGATGAVVNRGIREWLSGLRPRPAGLAVAVFDTRVDRVRHLPGSAASGASRLLRAVGAVPVTAKESFYVTGTEGPLVDGELERGREWGRRVGVLARDRAGSRTLSTSAVFARWSIAWLGGSVLAVLNGGVRDLFLVRLLDEPQARRLSTMLLLLVLTAYIASLHRRWPLRGARQALAVGATWVSLTLAFEFGFGHYVEGKSWSTLLADYDLLAGRVWVLVPVWTLLAPLVISRVSGRAAVEPPDGGDAVDREGPDVLGAVVVRREPAGLHLDGVDDPLDGRAVVVDVPDPDAGA